MSSKAGGCGQAGHGWDGRWCSLCCWATFGGRCLVFEGREGSQRAAWCPGCGAGVQWKEDA